MQKLLLSFAFISCTIISASGQQLYLPRDVKKAYVKGTRSTDGKPGKNYWQNRGRYDINMTVMPPDRTVRGTEQIVYSNNSPDTLRRLVINLIMNIHRAGAVRYSDAGADYLTPGIQIDEVKINGQTAKWRDPSAHVTWQYLNLPQALMPHDSITLSFTWHVQLSLQSNREGMIDSSTCFIAYFYPRVAVYDDNLGWDQMDFTDQQEFYNDFNDYRLQVTAPKNYVVWSTGDLLNPLEVLQPAAADRFAQSLTTDDIIHVATKQDMLGGKITTQQASITWKWSASNITDVTFGVSDHFVWDASSVIVDDQAKRRASVQAAFNDTARDFHQMVEFGKHALDWLSHKWPGVPYPFSKTTIFQGYADMEYPMMVNDGTQESPEFARFVAEHEIAHTWFPFYMGINESRYGFMDEGWATTFELLIGRDDLGKERAEDFYKEFRVNQWINDASAEEDLPIITPANVLRNASYGNNAYGKPSLGYLAVKDMLGDDLFRKCLHGYMDRWHGKHPLPWDFFNSFNNISGRDLNWFWQNWYFTNGYIDIGIKQVIDNPKGLNIVLNNIGGFPAPFDVLVKLVDGTEKTFHQTSAVWQPNIQQATIVLKGMSHPASIRIAGGIFMDADENNNQWKSK